jgi:hypothetical protein
VGSMGCAEGGKHGGNRVPGSRRRERARAGVQSAPETRSAKSEHESSAVGLVCIQRPLSCSSWIDYSHWEVVPAAGEALIDVCTRLVDIPSELWNYDVTIEPSCKCEYAQAALQLFRNRVRPAL